MQGLRIWRILLGVVGGVALVAVSLGLLQATPAQAGELYIPSTTAEEPPIIDFTFVFTDPGVKTNLGFATVRGGGGSRGDDQFLVTLHVQLVESNVQYQFNYDGLEGIIRDEVGNPIGVELSGQGELSGYGPFDATARIEARSDGDGIFILINGMPLPDGLQFEAKGSLTFAEEPDPPQ
jgi:hypothetical protein